MASVIVGPKQIATNNAYFITIGGFNATAATAATSGKTSGRVLFTNTGTVDAPTIEPSPLSIGGKASTLLSTPGAILRDMGLNVFSSGTVFRKVQLLQYSADTAETGGVAGDETTNFLTAYIVLPGLQGASAPTTENVSGEAIQPSAVARLG